ncbi:unnamed protein product [Mytilus coruscus]|uniref:C-type lectin domain-containing protein n=1 Tax=Mytilus coruscus TaxID=42192 RepID=A0A6J8DUR6_MYTCO|nr:unnamed protein product [Mytilus coruscus]
MVNWKTIERFIGHGKKDGFVQKMEASPNYTWYRAGYKPCREGWNFNDKSFGCYYISNTPLTWTDANEFCRNMSSCLTNILSREDMNWIENIENDSAWLGGWVGGSQNGQVYQRDCQQYKYLKQIISNSPLWANGETKPGNTTQCVQIYKLQTGFWLDDHPCSYLKRFVANQYQYL